MGRSQIPRVLMTLTLVLLQASSPELAAVFRSGSSKQSRDPPTQRSGWHLRLSTLQIDDPWLAHEVARVSAKPPKGDILKWGCFWGQQKAKWRLVPHFPLCFLTQFLPFSVSSLSVECSKDVSRVRTPFTLSTGSVPPLPLPLSPLPPKQTNTVTLWQPSRDDRAREGWAVCEALRVSNEEEGTQMAAGCPPGELAWFGLGWTRSGPSQRRRFRNWAERSQKINLKCTEFSLTQRVELALVKIHVGRVGTPGGHTACGQRL